MEVPRPASGSPDFREPLRRFRDFRETRHPWHNPRAMPIDKLKDVDIETLASLFPVTDRQIRTWVDRAGLPSKKDGRTRTFYWPDALEWYVGFRAAKDLGPAGDFPAEDQGDAPQTGKPTEDQRQANLRKTKAEADLRELSLAKMRGQMIGIAEAGIIVNRVFGNLRSQMLNMAPMLATRLAGQPEEAIQGIVRDAMEVLCRELSTGQIVGGVTAETEAEPEDPDTVDITAAAEISMLWLEEEARKLDNQVRGVLSGRITRAYARL